MIVHLTVAATEAIHAEVLAAHGGLPGLRDRGLLESAVSAPQATAFGEPVFRDVFEIAGAYLFYLCSNHPFVDGNKRVALACCLVFLSENGVLSEERFPLDVDTWEEFVLEVTASRFDREQTIAHLRQLLRHS